VTGKAWPPAGAVHRVVIIVNQKGLHARAAAAFAKTAGRYKARVLVRRGENIVSGLSIMGLMMLAAAPGTEIEIAATGADAEAAVAALEQLVALRFGED
jgi:phosphocarrier protein HPr